MKKKFIAVLMAVMAVSIAFAIAGCGKDKEGEAPAEVDSAVEKESVAEENNEDSSDEDAEHEPIEKTANIIDEIWLNNYDKEFMESEEYNPLFSERCFYVKGVRVHIPTTVRGFEKLFGTAFTSVMHGGYYSTYKDADDHVLVVEYTREAREKYSGDSEYDEKMKDMPIIGFYYDDTTYGKEHCLLNLNDVTFESVPKEDKDCANEYGYDWNNNIGDPDKTVYRFYPECYQAYYLYLNDQLPAEYIEDGLDNLKVEVTDVQYGDVSLDALDELFLFSDRDIRIVTYDAIDRKLRLLYWTEEMDSLSTDDGILVYTYDPKGFQDAYELTKYFVFNRYGKQWQLAELERWQDEKYNTYHTINGEEVDDDAFIDASRLYGSSGSFGGIGIELTVWGLRTYSGSSSYDKILSHKEELNLDAVGYDPDAKRDDSIGEGEQEESIDGDYETLRNALINAGFDVDTYGLGGFDVVVEAPDGYVNVREECGTEYPIITQLSNGTEVYIGECFVNSKGQLWGAITEPEFIGYIALSQVQQVKR